MADISEQKLESFVDAALDVQSVNDAFTPKIQAAASEDEQREVAEAATQAMRSAVDGTDGITVEEYVAIGQAAQTDQSLAQRITEKAQAKVQAMVGSAE